MGLFSQMSREELQQEIKRLKQEEEQAKQTHWESQYTMIRQKRILAESYLIDPSTIKIGDPYQIKGETGTFIVSQIKGIMAWGSWTDSTQPIAFPLVLLTPLPNK